MNTTTIVSFLPALTEMAEDRGIKGFVAKTILSNRPDEMLPFFNDLFNHGCISGIVSELIYYYQTHEFFDRFYDEIEELRLEYQESNGVPMTVESDYKNFMAWYAFEETAWRIFQELGLED
jgi:hypothetical protein